MSTGLNARRRRFAEEYLVDRNATQAAIRAGYSAKTAGQQGHDLLKKPEIQVLISEGEQARSERTQINQDRVVLELARVGFADIRDLVTWGEESVHFVPSDELDEDAAATVQAVKAKRIRLTRDDGDVEERLEMEIKTHSKVSALRDLLGHFSQIPTVDPRDKAQEIVDLVRESLAADLDGVDEAA